MSFPNNKRNANINNISFPTQFDLQRSKEILQWWDGKGLMKWVLFLMCKITKMGQGWDKIKVYLTPHRKMCFLSTSTLCLLVLESHLFGRAKDIIHFQILRTLVNISSDWVLFNLMSLLVNTLVNYNDLQ